jgi:peptidoglycan/LPS O-acetylase OafA/YrhL
MSAKGSATAGKKNHYRMDIQGIRGIAVLLVVLFHAEILFFSGGFIGVDVFFVLSGFVIAQVLLRELQKTGGIDLKRFYERRFRRLLPAAAVVSVVVMVSQSNRLTKTTSTNVTTNHLRSTSHLTLTPTKQPPLPKKAH